MLKLINKNNVRVDTSFWVPRTRISSYIARRICATGLALRQHIVKMESQRNLDLIILNLESQLSNVSRAKREYNEEEYKSGSKFLVQRLML
ncbi:hypothetical protein SUGI_0378420 [Cryptomeria japonica]|nr:hypothetical protein SUGI_0378420 [Cryptomeria japonica]